MVSVQTTAGLERRMEVQVPAARVEQAIQARLSELARTVKLEGFRPGKVPPAVIRQRFGRQVHNEVIEELVRESFSEAVTEQKLIPAGGPRIEPVEPLAGQDLKYTAVFEVYPEVKLKGLDSLAVEKPLVKVGAEDVEAMVEHLRKQRPNWKTANRAAQKGDRVTVDFEGRIDDVPFEGGTAADFPIYLGEGRMLPEFETGIEGATAGSDKKVSLRFPDDYRATNLAGKTAQFTIKVKAVDEAELPALDDEFSKAFGVPEGGPEELKRQINENMQRQVEQDVRGRIKTQLLDALYQANPLELPRSLVDQQISDLQVEFGRRNGIADVKQIPPRENFEDNARRRVALGLLINEIIDQEKIMPSQEAVQARLLDVIASMPNPQEALQRYRQNREAMQQVEALVLEDQVVDWLLSKAKVTEKSQSFKEFTQFGA